MTELENVRALERYDLWKAAKQRRKRWISFLASVLGLLFAYIFASVMVKTFNTKKAFFYGFATEYKPDYKKTQEQHNLPSDYATWYSQLENGFWQKKLGHDKEYFTKEKIVEREAGKQGKKMGGGIGEVIGGWLGSKLSGLSDKEKKEIDYNAYAQDVYVKTCLGFLITAPLAWIVFGIIGSLILHFSWREPRLSEQDLDKA